jgi:hypothetical protein
MKNHDAQEILHWFGAYWNSPNVDKVFFGKLARLVLEERPEMCEGDRRLLQNAFLSRKGSSAETHGDFICSLNTKDTSQTFSELLLIAKAIGFNSDLNFAEVKEQILARSSVVNKKDLDYGIWRHILGFPESEIEKKLDERNAKIKITAAPPHPGSFVKLCRTLEVERKNKGEDVRGLENYFAFIKKSLDQTREFPEGMQPKPESKTYRAWLSEDQFKADLAVIESGCREKKTVIRSATPAVVSPQKAPSDFSPGRRKKH